MVELSAKWAKDLWSDMIAVRGEIMAEDVILMEKIFNWLPLMYIIKAFIKICWLLGEKQGKIENKKSKTSTKVTKTQPITAMHVIPLS